MKKVFVSNISWEADDMSDVADLPTSCSVVINDNDVDDIDNFEEVDQYISDYLSDTYGFTHAWYSTSIDGEVAA